MNVNVHVIGLILTVLATLFLQLFGLILGIIAWVLIALQAQKKT